MSGLEGFWARWVECRKVVCAKSSEVEENKESRLEKVAKSSYFVDKSGDIANFRYANGQAGCCDLVSWR